MRSDSVRIWCARSYQCKQQSVCAQSALGPFFSFFPELLFLSAIHAVISGFVTLLEHSIFLEYFQCFHLIVSRYRWNDRSKEAKWKRKRLRNITIMKSAHNLCIFLSANTIWIGGKAFMQIIKMWLHKFKMLKSNFFPRIFFEMVARHIFAISIG